ncbi:MAG: hypothetical protein RRZ84_01210 [Romboutsia sp.]
MDNKEQYSLNINGIGNYSGGEFDRIDISGVGKVNGDLKCNTFDSSGIGKIYGNIQSDKFNTSGITKVEGNITSKSIDISGMLKCTKDIKVDKIEVSGTVTIEGKLNSNKIVGSGLLNVKSDIQCEEVDINGIITCVGMLNCEKLELNLVGRSTIDEIGGSKIDIRGGMYSSRFNILAPKKFRENKLVANIIEGDDITLENCEVKIVRGKNINIGQNCKIDKIEYSQSIEVDKYSKILDIVEVK